MQIATHPSPAASHPLRWGYIAWFVSLHITALAVLWYLIFIRTLWTDIALAISLFFAMHLSITVGLHRLYSHDAFKAAKSIEVVLLLLSAGVMQSSALWWAGRHREHHRYSDKDKDPYSVVHGIWWAHIGWLLRQHDPIERALVRDLYNNPLVKRQEENYWWLAPLMGLGLPTAIASFWGEPLGGLFVAGFLRLCVQYHATWVINSVAHSFGSYRYQKHDTARTNGGILAILTVGESYHERHHLAPNDYRLGNRWYDIDPGKWVIWLLAHVGLARDLQTREESALT
ncbi:MAG TPA: fatty acid desaturase [Candidatus Paceibacterota bacterium]|nr:fatty acid desaturase [Candidatus Paceibacterota bacterium]